MSVDHTVVFEATDCQEINNRSVFYKKPIKKNNYRLDVDYDDTPQEIRRKNLLNFQKKSREAIFDEARDILDESLISDDEIEEILEVDGKPVKKYSRKRNKHYANKLMMSEWMKDVPEDFVEKWFMVPCPKGNHNLLVACKGKTCAYNRRGEKFVVFQSALPGGHKEQNNNNCTILDCIWERNQKVYYVLDVLAWSNQPLLNCDAEFRQFWIRSKLREMEKLQSRDTSCNKYPILTLPNIGCNENLSEIFENRLPFPSLDGVLFYHREGHYMYGLTPLVTWLKPYMLPEVLGLSVPPPLDEKPDGYIDLNHHILSKHRKRKEKSDCVELSMEFIDENE